MRLVLTGKTGPHKKWADILPKFDKQNTFIPITAGQLFKAKLTACKIVPQEVFGDIIIKTKKTGTDYLTIFRKTVHEPKTWKYVGSDCWF